MSNDQAKRAGEIEFCFDGERFLYAYPARFDADVLAFFRTGHDGVYLTRADCKGLRGWLTAHLEETKPKPQPGEVWELRDRGGRFALSADGGAWINVKDGGWIYRRDDEPSRRIGKIVFD